MSLILDALNKADRENRKPESSPNLETEHAQPIELPAKSSNLSWIFLMLFICAVFGVAVFFIFNKSNPFTNRSQIIEPTFTDSAQAKNVSPALVTASSQTITSNTMNNTTTSLQTNVAVQTPNKAEELRQKFIQAQYAQQQTVNKDLTSQSPTQQPKAQKQITGLYQQPTATQQGTPKETVPVATKKPKIQTPKKHTENVPKQISTSDSQLDFYDHIGSVRDLPFNAQNNVPTMMYTEHNYKRKSVTINGKEYREKSSIGKGLVIEKVLEDGLILKYQQYTFKMRAYNNWINL